MSFLPKQAKKLPKDAVGDGEVESDVDEDDEDFDKPGADKAAGDATQVFKFQVISTSRQKS